MRATHSCRSVAAPRRRPQTHACSVQLLTLFAAWLLHGKLDCPIARCPEQPPVLAERGVGWVNHSPPLGDRTQHRVRALRKTDHGDDLPCMRASACELPSILDLRCPSGCIPWSCPECGQPSATACQGSSWSCRRSTNSTGGLRHGTFAMLSPRLHSGSSPTLEPNPRRRLPVTCSATASGNVLQAALGARSCTNGANKRETSVGERQPQKANNT